MGTKKVARDGGESARPVAGTAGWDTVDEAGWESFPASDPPAIDSVFPLEPRVGRGAAPERGPTGPERLEEDVAEE